MPKVCTCPHCEYEVRVETLDSDGHFRCPFCENTFDPGEMPAPAPDGVIDSLPVAEVVRPASSEVPPAPVPVAIGDWEEIAKGLDAIPVEPPQPWKPPGGKSKRGILPARKNPWRTFGRGSAMAKSGLWIEFIGSACALLVAGYLFLSSIDRPGGRADRLGNLGGPFLLAPFFLGSAYGTTMVWLGRARMMTIPAESGAQGVLVGAWIFTSIRLAAVLGATILLILAALAWGGSEFGLAGRSEAGDYIGFALLVWLIGVPFWILADLSSLPAMAIVGGAIPNLALRQRAGQVTFVLQLVFIGYVMIAIISAVTGITDGLGSRGGPETGDRSSFGTRPAPAYSTTTRSTASSSVQNQAAVMFVFALAILLQFAYTMLYASLYTAGVQAATEARGTEEAAEDDDG